MLIKMLPDQVAHYWDILSYGVQQSLPPITIESPRRMNKILESIMLEYMDLWLITSEKKVQGLIVTSISYDRNSDVQDLLVYCFYSFRDLPISLIKKDLNILKDYAKSKGCKRLTAYSNVESVVRFWKAMGSDNYSFLSIPVNGEIDL